MNEWHPVVDYEGLYEVSSDGDVRTVKSGRVLSRHQERKAGYWVVRLSKKNKAKTWMVHRLVAYAFLGPRPDGCDIRHLDGDASNSRVENLAYGTRAQNQRDAVIHGTHANASKSACPQGHEYTPENTSIRKRGGRACRACHRERQRPRNLKRQQQRSATTRRRLAAACALSQLLGELPQPINWSLDEWDAVAAFMRRIAEENVDDRPHH